jgi:cytochrome P450
MDLISSLAENFDYTDPRTADRLRDVYGYLRSHCPVAHSPAHGGAWIVSKYDDICAAARNFEAFSSAGGTTLPAVGNPVPALPPESDPPLHTVAREAMMPFLSPGAVKSLEPYVRRIVTRLVDDFIEAGEADLVADLAKLIPAHVVARLCGFDPEDGADIFTWADMMAVGAGSGDMALVEKGATAYFQFLQRVIDERRATPREDLIDAVLNIEIDGRLFTNEECLGMLFTTTIGAIETTVNGIAHGLRLIAKNPQVHERLVADPTLTVRAVQEILRMEAPAQMLARTVRKEVELGGTTLSPGDRVLLLWGSGNHDPDRFPNPEEFDIDRPRNLHLSFGHGIHQCAGMHLARMEMRVAIEEVITRIPDFRLVEDVEPVAIGGVAWSLRRLPVSFTPGRRSQD